MKIDGITLIIIIGVVVLAFAAAIAYDFRKLYNDKHHL